MANTPKKGLDYFPLEVGYFADPKTELINAEFGIDGEYLFLRILSIIYSDEGYYCDWNKDKALILAKKCGFSLDKIEMILARLVERSMFNEQLFHSAKVLTSRKIQKVYIRACAERQSIDIQEEYFLLDENDLKKIPLASFNKLALYSKNQPINKIKPPINKIKPPINSQSKVKESKVKKSTDIRAGAEAPIARTQFIQPTLEEVQQYCRERNNSINAERFMDHYISNGWLIGKTEMKDWRAAVRKWEKNGIDDAKTTIYHKPKHGFNDFTQRTDWDFEKLEKKAMEV